VIASRPPSIRVLFGTLLALVMLLAAGLFSVTILQRDTATRRTDAEHQRVTSFRLSDQMRQSSNDLTRMVRLYVTTGEPRYRRYYDEILAIRRGAAPRPRSYDSSFWDRVLADDTPAVRTGPPTSLPGLMRRAHFSGAEFTALNASLHASDHLARLEKRVMDAVAPRIAAGVDRAYLGDVAPQYHRLVDDAYHHEKRRIMNAIEPLREARRRSYERAHGGAAVAHRPAARVADGHPRPAGRHPAADARARRADDRSAAHALDRRDASMSHELRTPLVAVLGTMEMLALGDLDGQQRAFVDVATRSARSLLGVIGDVLDFSKIEAGHLDLAPVPTAVGALVDDVVTQHRLAAPAGGVTLRTSIDARLAARHEVDPVRLRQVPRAPAPGARQPRRQRREVHERGVHRGARGGP